ncbi:MAG: hypothetical protein CGU28_15640 [Candidatus Dactylopiibacterium carminicum]|nr:MAG: hypothetical protein CGU28_15640 [Candidatus Dactylopiibacterium carminicum]
MCRNAVEAYAEQARQIEQPSVEIGRWQRLSVRDDTAHAFQAAHQRSQRGPCFEYDLRAPAGQLRCEAAKLDAVSQPLFTAQEDAFARQ